MLCGHYYVWCSSVLIMCACVSLLATWLWWSEQRGQCKGVWLWGVWSSGCWQYWYRVGQNRWSVNTHSAVNWISSQYYSGGIFQCQETMEGSGTSPQAPFWWWLPAWQLSAAHGRGCGMTSPASTDVMTNQARVHIQMSASLDKHQSDPDWQMFHPT